MSNDTSAVWTAPSLPQAAQDNDNPSGQFLTLDRLRSLPSESLTCEVPISSGMFASDIVRVRGAFGDVVYDANEISIPNPPPRSLSTSLPKFLLYGVAGNVLTLNFALRKPTGGGWQISQSRLVRVEQQPLALERPALPYSSRTLEIRYSGMTSKHTIRPRLFSETGSFIDLAQIPGSQAGVVNAVINRSWFQENAGRRVWLNYAVKTASTDPYWLVSRVLYIERLDVPPA